jgi:hypothetical protein
MNHEWIRHDRTGGTADATTEGRGDDSRFVRRPGFAEVVANRSTNLYGTSLGLETEHGPYWVDGPVIQASDDARALERASLTRSGEFPDGVRGRVVAVRVYRLVLGPGAGEFIR